MIDSESVVQIKMKAKLPREFYLSWNQSENFRNAGVRKIRASSEARKPIIDQSQFSLSIICFSLIQNHTIAIQLMQVSDEMTRSL